MVFPTAFCIAADGTVYICQQEGALRVWKEGIGLLTVQFFANTPLVMTSANERGLLGIDLDPDFQINHHLYVYYTATVPAIHHRISRFTANASGELALAGSETVLLDLNDVTELDHNGGGLHFGPDRRLYVGVGDNQTGSNAQSLSNFFGKILRINADPRSVIPSDNPSSFAGISGAPTGDNRAVWAVGLRNPFSFAFQPGTGRMFINDVGDLTWEEVDDGIAGRNYGWPSTEGDFNQASFPDFTRPVMAYSHSVGRCVCGGVFYSPPISPFPVSFYGRYLVGDHVSGWIKQLDPATGALAAFATGVDRVVDVRVDDRGRLLYLTTLGVLGRVDYVNPLPPSVTSQSSGQAVCLGDTVRFCVTVSGTSPLTFAWRRGGMVLADDGRHTGSATRTLTIAGAQPADIGSYDCIIQNAYGVVTTAPMLLAVGISTGQYDGSLIEPFVQAVIEQATDAASRCEFDFNRDNVVDDRDITGMVAALLTA